jgi:RNA polymerase sigma-70 factor, ECF subfamily
MKVSDFEEKGNCTVSDRVGKSFVSHVQTRTALGARRVFAVSILPQPSYFAGSPVEISFVDSISKEEISQKFRSFSWAPRHTVRFLSRPHHFQTIFETQHPVSNESNIAEKIRHGDVEAFSLLFRQQYEPLCHFAHRFVSDFDAAEGIVQDVFVRMWEMREKATIHTSLKSYLFTAVRNSCLNQIKHGKYASPLQDLEEGSGPTTSHPDAQLESNELARALEKAIEGLPPKCREIFCMAKYDGLSYQEIADIQGVSLNTVKTQLKRALKSLSSSLSYLRVLSLLLTLLSLSCTQNPDVTRSLVSVVLSVGDEIQQEIP